MTQDKDRAAFEADDLHLPDPVANIGLVGIHPLPPLHRKNVVPHQTYLVLESEALAYAEARVQAAIAHDRQQRGEPFGYVYETPTGYRFFFVLKGESQCISNSWTETPVYAAPQPAEPVSEPEETSSIGRVAERILAALRADDHGDLLRANDHGPMASIKRALLATSYHNPSNAPAEPVSEDRQDEIKRLHDAFDRGKWFGSRYGKNTPQPAEPVKVDHTPPYKNCSFKLCDLPGQCRYEGKCHHPKPDGPVGGEPVGIVRHFYYSGVARNGFFQEAVLNDGTPTIPDGTPLYTSPQPSERDQRAYQDAEPVDTQSSEVEPVSLPERDTSKPVKQQGLFRKYDGTFWRPIETAPRDNKNPLFVARFSDNRLCELGFNARWEYWQESWELSHINGFYWANDGDVEEPTHWAYQPSVTNTAPAGPCCASESGEPSGP